MNSHTADPIVPSQLALPVPAASSGANGTQDDRELEGGLEGYQPVPPRKSVIVSVRYQVRGRGQPLPFDADWKDGE